MTSTHSIALRTPWLVIRLQVDRAEPATERPRQAGFVVEDPEQGLRALARMGLCDPIPDRQRIDELALLDASFAPAPADSAARPWM